MKVEEEIIHFLFVLFHLRVYHHLHKRSGYFHQKITTQYLIVLDED